MLVMTQDTLKQIYDFNQKPENWIPKDYTPGTKKKAKDQWGGGRTRRLLGLAYTIAFSCLLRVDEVLKIKSPDFRLEGENKLKLKLAFRKTNPVGGESDLKKEK
jgi:hypothetical protein